MIPLTAAEARRLFNLHTRVTRPQAFHEQWSDWRRYRLLPVGQGERGGVFGGERVHDVNGPIRRSRTGLVLGVSR
jgi:hypothetical protein